MSVAAPRCRHPLPAGVPVAGVRVDPLPTAALGEAVDAFVACGRSHVVHFLPADPITRALDDRAYREVLQAGDLNLPDGMSVVWALRLAGVRAERVAGPDAMRSLLGGPWAHYLFGGRPDVLARAADRARAAGARIAGAEAPPFGELSDAFLAGAAARMRAAGAEVVWVGLGTPKQDRVAERLRDLGAAPAICCVGAAFDLLGGASRRAPAWMQRAGLEWAFRLGTEPRRLWRRYLVGGPRFLAAVARDRWRRR